MIELIWPSGEMTTGHTWSDVEDAIRAAQWSTFKTRIGFRREMRRRAKIWSGSEVPITGPDSRSFIHDLAHAGMFMIFVTEEEPDGKE